MSTPDVHKLILRRAQGERADARDRGPRTAQAEPVEAGFSNFSSKPLGTLDGPTMTVRAVDLLVAVYRVTLSPLIGPACRFHPTCSEYARQAVHRHGVRRGAWMALRRLARCHPFHPGGWDPVH